MKKACLASGVWLVAALLGQLAQGAIFPVSAGDYVALTDGVGGWGQTPSTNGGSFNVDVVGRGGASDFVTFCAELSEHIHFGVPYRIAATSMQTSLSGKTMTQLAAFVFRKFSEGSLTWSGTATASSLTTVQKMDIIQYGLWNELGWGDGLIMSGYLGTPTEWKAREWYLNSEKAVWQAGLAADAIWSNNPNYYGDVRILNLVNGNKQDQFGIVVIPEPASMLVWSGIGLAGAGLALARRRRAVRRWSAENRNAILNVIDSHRHV